MTAPAKEKDTPSSSVCLRWLNKPNRFCSPIRPIIQKNLTTIGFTLLFLSGFTRPPYFFKTSARGILQKDMKQLDELAASALQADLGLGWRSLDIENPPSMRPSEVLCLWCGFWKLVSDPKPTCFYFTSNFGSTDFLTDFLLIGRNTDVLSSRHWKQLAWISYPILTLDVVIPM